MMANWKDIHSDFSYHGWDWETNYKQEWISKGFDYEQTQDWINAGLKPKDAEFCAWLRDIKQTNAEWVLNHCNVEELRQEFQESLRERAG